MGHIGCHAVVTHHEEPLKKNEIFKKLIKLEAALNDIGVVSPQ
jgi:hypothetical protein